MHKSLNLILIIAGLAVLLGSAGCKGDFTAFKERKVGKVSTTFVYDISLYRAIKNSKEVIRTRERNVFFGFSPKRELTLMRDNLGYLIEQTALVLPAGALDKREVSAEADRRANALAQDVYERLLAGESWEQLNEEYSFYGDKEGGGIMPPFGRDVARMPEDFFNLKQGELLEPVRTSWGYDIYRLDEITEGPDGEPQYNARRILIMPDEKKVKAEMIDEVLNRKQVEILDPVIKGFDMYIGGEYEEAIEYLEKKSPAPAWPDLGYYVLSLCAKELGDREKRLEYLNKAIENIPEAGTLLPYYEFEVGDLLWEMGDESAKEHYRRAYDNSSNDYDIVLMGIERFMEVGDEEYAGIARKRKEEMDAYNKGIDSRGAPDGEIKTGSVTPDKPEFEDL